MCFNVFQLQESLSYVFSRPTTRIHPVCRTMIFRLLDKYCCKTLWCLGTRLVFVYLLYSLPNQPFLYSNSLLSYSLQQWQNSSLLRTHAPFTLVLSPYWPRVRLFVRYSQLVRDWLSLRPDSKPPSNITETQYHLNSPPSSTAAI